MLMDAATCSGDICYQLNALSMLSTHVEGVDEADLCQICFTSPRAVRLLPCCHCTTCVTCTVRLLGSRRSQCPNCRSPIERLDWHAPALPIVDTPPVPARMKTYEKPEGDGLSIRQFLLSAAVEPLVRHTAAALPAALLDRVGAALHALRSEGPLFGAARDRCWRDLIDPDLCLATPPADAGAPPQWQTAEADTDADGRVRWASWVNHLHPERHGALLADLAALLGLALPHLEAVGGAPLRGRRLQLVVGAFEHALTPAAGAAAEGGGEGEGEGEGEGGEGEGEDEGEEAFYRVSDWHTDGTPAEHVLATAICYIEIGAGLAGGALEFARLAEVWADDADPAATLAVRPASGCLVAFNNALLRHRVLTLRGRGRRRLVVFHLVDPDHRQQPAADALPRQAEALSAEELQRRRDASRRRRLGTRDEARAAPRRFATGTFVRRATGTWAPNFGTGVSFNSGTGTSHETPDDEEGGGDGSGDDDPAPGLDDGGGGGDDDDDDDDDDDRAARALSREESARVRQMLAAVRLPAMEEDAPRLDDDLGPGDPPSPAGHAPGAARVATPRPRHQSCTVQ